MLKSDHTSKKETKQGYCLSGNFDKHTSCKAFLPCVYYFVNSV